MTPVGEIISAYSGLTIQQSILLIVFILTVIAVIGYFLASYGIQTKWFTIGGGKRDQKQSRHDLNLKEQLKNKTDEIDREATNELYDLVRHLSRGFFAFLGQHCYFTLYALADVYKDVLKERIRHNNLKDKLVPTRKEEYTDFLVGILRSEYTDMRTRTLSTACQEIYPDFDVVEKFVRDSVTQFWDRAQRIEMKSIQQKIDLYTDYQERFQSKFYKETACTEPLERNKRYLQRLSDAAVG